MQTSSLERAELKALRRELVREQRIVNIRRFFRNGLSVVGLVIVLLMVLIAIFAPMITGALGVDPYTSLGREMRLQPPSREHPFGTDNVNRDVFARVIYGTRISMTVGFLVGLLSALLGTAIGM